MWSKQRRQNNNCWKSGWNDCEEFYLLAKKDSKRAAYAAKKTAEEERFINIIIKKR